MINDEFNRKVFRREVAHHLHDMPSIRTGMVSKAYKDLPIGDLTKEHFYPRQQSADKIIKLLDKGKLTENRLARILKSRARVHYVHSTENNALRTVQKDPALKTWRQQYATLGIELVQYQNKKPGRKPNNVS